MVAHGERSAAATAPCRVHPRTWRGEIREPDRAGQLRSDRTNCRKDGQPSRVQAAKNQASWYCLSWRGLQSGASTPDDSRLNTPETTPPSIPTTPATAPQSSYSTDRESLFSGISGGRLRPFKRPTGGGPSRCCWAGHRPAVGTIQPV